MESRENLRYDISEPEKLILTWEVDLDGEIISGNMNNISLGGFGILVPDLDRRKAEMLGSMKDFFIKIRINDDLFIAGVHLVWSFWEEGKGSAFQGGLKLTIISPEDNLKLSSYISIYNSGV